MSKGQRKGRRKSRRDSNLHPKILISGYYGFDNLGDELILRVLVDELKRHKADVMVLSANPRKTAETYQVKAIGRMHLIDIIDALTQTNLFISGGGGLFQDATGPMSPLYYGGLIHLARFFEVPVCFLAQGVGPLNSGLGRSFTAGALKECQIITVRDEASARLVADLTGIQPEVTGDPVWLFKAPKHQKRGNGRYTVGISLRPWPALTPERLTTLARTLTELADAQGPANTRFVLLPFQKHEDTRLLERLQEELTALTQAECVIDPGERLPETIAECNALLGMRFHSLVLALLSGVPAYGLVYDPKVASLLSRFELEGTPIDGLDTLKAADLLAYFTHRYPDIHLDALKAGARRNFDILRPHLHPAEAELVI